MRIALIQYRKRTAPSGNPQYFFGRVRYKFPVLKALQAFFQRMNDGLGQAFTAPLCHLASQLLGLGVPYADSHEAPLYIILTKVYTRYEPMSATLVGTSP